jgi:hypothetical protein
MSTATNGTATVTAQHVEYAENASNAIDARTWRRAFSGAGVALLLALASNVVLAEKYQHDVFVFERTPQGLVAAGPAAEESTPQQFDIQAQLGAWIRAYKDVPGDDKMVDRNLVEFFATYWVRRPSRRGRCTARPQHEAAAVICHRKPHRPAAPARGPFEHCRGTHIPVRQPLSTAARERSRQITMAGDRG